MKRKFWRKQRKTSKELQLLIDEQLQTISENLNEPLSYSTKCCSSSHLEKPVWYSICKCQKLDPVEIKKHTELVQEMENM